MDRLHLLQTLQSLIYLNTIPQSVKDQASRELNHVYLPPPASPGQSKTLIFDLDETLTHCVDTEDSQTPSFTKNFSRKPQHTVHIPTRDFQQKLEYIKAGINLRPYLRECLTQCAAKY